MPARNRATPLFLAVSRGKIEVVEFLLSQGAKIDTSNSTFNPILYASKKNYGAIVKVLESAVAQQEASSIPSSKAEESTSATIHIETEPQKSPKSGV